MEYNEEENVMDLEELSTLGDFESFDQEGDSVIDILPPPALTDYQFTRLELLQRLSLYSELVILLSADRGMGKTLLAQALLATRETPDKSLMIDADISLSYRDILAEVSGVLGLDKISGDLETLENSVISQCLQLFNESQGSMLLILDQATQLDDEVLEDLNNLALLAPNALHLMLIAVPDFEQKLSLLSEPRAPIHIVDIDALSDDETTALLLQSFPGKEWSDEEIEYILEKSEGNPGKTIYIAQEFFSGNKTVSTTATAASKFPIVHVAALIIVAMVLVGFYFYQSSSQGSAAEPANKERESNIHNSAAEINQTDRQAEEGEDMDGGVDKIEAALVEAKVISTVAVTPVSESSAFNDIDSKAAPVAEEDEGKVDFNFAGVKQANSGEIEPSSFVKNKKTNEQSLDIEKNKVADINTDAPIMAESNGNFVIQLFGSYNKKNAKAFITTYNAAEISLRLYQTVNNGQPWYVVVTKPYANRAIAKDQASKLPIKLRSQNPWVRTVESLNGK